MEVNLYATLRAIVGQKTVQVDLAPNTTVQQLIELVASRNPDLQMALLDAERRLQPHMKMFINGREVVYLEDKFDAIIQPNDKIDIFPPVGGG